MSCLKARVGERTGIFKAVSGVLVVCLPIIMACAEDAASAGWHLINSCGISFYGASTNMMYWAKGSASGTKGASTVGLTEGEDYFVSGTKRFTSLGKTGYEFLGRSLTLGDDTSGGILYLRATKQTFSNLILNRGTIYHAIYRSNPNVINYYDNMFGSAKVNSPKDRPFTLLSDYKNLWMGWGGEIIGDADVGMMIGSLTSGYTNQLVSITNAAAYYGEIVVTSKFVNTGRAFGAGLGVGGSIPGTVRIKGGSIIKPHNPTAVADLGELHMDAGTGMWFVYDSGAMKGGFIRVSNALTLPEKVTVHALTGYSDGKWLPPVSTTGEEVRSPFLMGPPGVRIDPKIFEFVPDPAYEPQEVTGKRPQRVHFETETDSVSGRDTVYAVIEPIVEMVKGQSDVRGEADALALGTALTNATFWSDGRIPHAKAHYVINYRLLTSCEDNVEYVFPGRSLLFYKGGFGVFGGNHRLNIPDFQIASIVEQGQGGSVTICGGRARLCDDSVTLRAYANNTFTIESEMVGPANLNLTGETGTSSPHGYFAFKGLNTNWFGCITVTAPENSSVDDFVSDLLTIRLYDGRNLGGELPQFNYRALALGRYCELYAHTNVTLDASVNRGIFLSHEKGAKFVVDEGYTLKCNWPITLNGPLYKTQSGTLALGGGVKFYDGEADTDTLPEDPSKRLLIVTNGTLKALSHDCVNGLTVALAKNYNTSLAIDFVEEDCNLKKYGFYNVKTDTPFEAGNSINIQLDGVEGETVKGLREYKQGLVTVKTTAANALGLDGLIKFKKPFASGCPNVRLVREDDSDTGLTTYSAQYKFVGAQIIVR